MRCLLLDWFNVESVEDLKNLGKFNEVRSKIKCDGGATIHVSGRGWNDLFSAIKELKETVQKLKLNTIGEKRVEEELQASHVKISTNVYFKTRADEYIFYLIELDGEQQMNKLEITPAHFSSKRKAKAWRNEISKIIHPDVCQHVYASQAMAQLNDIYEQMLGTSR